MKITRLFVTIFAICLVSLLSPQSQARSEFPIDLDITDSSNALEWRLKDVSSWVYLLVSEELISQEQANQFNWQVLHTMGTKVFTFHWFLADSKIFSDEEIIQAFGIANFYENERPNNEEWLKRELSPIEIVTVCARLTKILAEKKELPIVVVRAKEQLLSRQSSEVARVEFMSTSLNGFGNADLIISVSSELITHGETYSIYSEKGQEVIAEGNELTFLLKGKLGWEFSISDVNYNKTLESLGITSGKSQSEVTIQGMVEYLGNKREVSEITIISHNIIPLLQITKTGTYSFECNSEVDAFLTGGGLKAVFDSESPEEFVMMINLNGESVGVKCIRTSNEGNWYNFSSRYGNPLFAFKAGSEEFTLSFPNGERPDVLYFGPWPNEPIDYRFINEFDSPPSPWGVSTGGGGGSQ